MSTGSTIEVRVEKEKIYRGDDVRGGDTSASLERLEGRGCSAAVFHVGQRAGEEVPHLSRGGGKQRQPEPALSCGNRPLPC